MSENEVKLVLSGGEVKTVLVQAPCEGELVIFDALRFTVQERTFQMIEGGCVTDLDLAYRVSEELKKIFGFGVTAKLEKGRDFYDCAYTLGDNWGHIAFGGKKQRGSVLVSIMGQGLLAAVDGWETRLYTWLKTIGSCPKITRADLAFDWFDGAVKVDDIVPHWQMGHFDRYYNRPNCEQVGPWLSGDPMGHGRSVYLGTRESSLLFRFYEKGKQLGGYQSPWVRGEAEIAARGVVIPLEILLEPTKYFVALYPIFGLWFGGDTRKLTTNQKKEAKFETLQGGFTHTARWATHQFGKKLSVMREVLGDEALLDLICTAETDPSVFKVPDLSFSPPAMPEPSVLPFNVALWRVFGVRPDEGEDDYVKPENFVITAPMTWDDLYESQQPATVN